MLRLSRCIEELAIYFSSGHYDVTDMNGLFYVVLHRVTEPTAYFGSVDYDVRA